MRLRRIALLLTCVFTVSSLNACSSASNVEEEKNSDYEVTKENSASSDENTEVDIPVSDSQGSEDTDLNKLKIGETASFTVEEDGTMDVTITDWGISWNDMKEENTIYFDVEFENTGSTKIEIGPSMFSVYADDYSTELSYLELDVLQTTSLHGGRKARGKVYATVNADSVDKIEVQIAKTVWVLKDGKNSENIESVGEAASTDMPENTEPENETASTVEPENTESENETSDTGIPENLIYGEEDLGNIAGMYWDYTATSNVELSMYSSPEENAVGNVKVYYSGTLTYTGEIEQVATNVYHLGLDGADIYFGFYTETQGDEKAMKMHMVINGSEEDWYSRTQEFVS